MDEATNSWASFVLRTTIGTEEIRNNILNNYLKNIPNASNIEYGPTFTVGVPKKKVYNFLNKIISYMKNNEDKIVLFTCNSNFGTASKKLIETHYQTFIIQTRSRRITMIDPSRLRDKIGYYGPWAAMFVFYYIKARVHDTKFYWLNLSQPCQVKYSKNDEDADVFCQTWSLYLQIQALLQNANTINIPYNLSDKYNLLMNFYIQLLDTPEFRAELITRWNGKNNDLDENKEYLTKEQLDNYKKLDILQIVKNMTGEDLYNKNSKMKIKEETGPYNNKISNSEIEDYSLMMENHKEVFPEEIIRNLYKNIENDTRESYNINAIRKYMLTPIYIKSIKSIKSPKSPRKSRKSRKRSRYSPYELSPKQLRMALSNSLATASPKIK
jgi:hypothetical protein